MEGEFDLRQLLVAGSVIVLAGVIFGMGSYINSQLQSIYPTLSAVTVTNEAAAFVTNNADVALAMYNIGNGVSVAGVGNTTNALTSSNYSYTTLGLVRLTITNTTALSVRSYNVNYSYSPYSTSYWASQNSSVALGTMSSWLQIIGLVLAAGIIIAILVKSFTGRQSVESGI